MSGVPTAGAPIKLLTSSISEATLATFNGDAGYRSDAVSCSFAGVTDGYGDGQRPKHGELERWEQPVWLNTKGHVDLAQCSYEIVTRLAGVLSLDAVKLSGWFGDSPALRQWMETTHRCRHGRPGPGAR